MATDLQIASGSPATVEADAVVIGLLPGADDGPVRLAPGAEELDAAFDGELAALLTVAGATGKAERCRQAADPRRADGPAARRGRAGQARRRRLAPSAEQVRRASGAAARALAGTARAASTLGRLDLAAAAEGTLLGAYTFTAYRSGNGNARKDPVGSMVLLGADADDAEATVRTAVAVAEAVQHRPGPGQHPAQRPVPGVLRRPRRGAGRGGRGRGGGARRRRAGRGRVRRRARGRPGLARASPGWSGCAGRAGTPRGPRSRWSARASPSTPAASRSSRRRTWTT